MTQIMKNDKLIQILQGLGLTDKEASTYLACLSLGPTTVLKISRVANLKRTTVYSVAEQLKQKGLLSIEIRGFKQLFVAEDPDNLEAVLDERREKLKLAMPDLSALFNLKGGEGKIKYYEGLEAIKSVYETLLRDVMPHEDYLVVGDQSMWYKLDPDYFRNFIERRAKLNINIKLLFQDSAIAREHKKLEKNFSEKVKILPPETTLTTNMVIIPRRLVIHQLTPPIMAIVIENKSVIQMHHELFEIIWRSVGF